jgi:hypothetical protein
MREGRRRREREREREGEGEGERLLARSVLSSSPTNHS